MSGFTRDLDHPLRFELNNEVHARPAERLETPCSHSYFARVSGPELDEFELLAGLLEHFGKPVPNEDTKQHSVDLGDFRLRWERHTEFARYGVTVEGPVDKPFSKPPISMLPPEWLKQLRASILTALHTSVLEYDDTKFTLQGVSAKLFNGNVLVGSSIAGGAAVALTDFRIHDDGFSRLMVFNKSMNVRQTGRMVQRLHEIETYRMMTLLALPMAQSLAPRLSQMEKEVGQIGSALAAGVNDDDQALLDRIFRLTAESEASQTAGQYRFAAAEAYYRLVQQRTSDLREERLSGLQTFQEFYSRRLAPAVETCRSTAKRQESVSDRTMRATQLLSTRVDVERQHQNQTLLASMNERARMQLRLQATVEGLSVAAITYYVVGLLYYLFRGLDSYGLPISSSLLTAACVPLVAVSIWFAVRRIRKRVSGDEP